METVSPKKHAASSGKKASAKNKSKTPIFTRFKTFHPGQNGSINEDANEGLNSEDISPHLE